MVIILSTRGSADTIICFLVLLTLLFLLKRQFRISAVLFGLSIHFKIYPIVYSLLFFMFCGTNTNQEKNPKRRFGIRNAMVFVSFSLASLFGLTYIFYKCYGIEFIEQTYAYHFSRVDIRHNYSIFFYPLYLLTANSEYPGFCVWIPHLLLFPVISLGIFKDSQHPECLLFRVFLLSFLFVTFNKVITAQYFLWWIAPLTLVIPYCHLSIKQWLFSILSLLLTQNLWNYFAFQLEFVGKNCFLHVWIACVLFFVANIRFAVVLIRSFRVAKVYPDGISKED